MAASYRTIFLRASPPFRPAEKDLERLHKKEFPLLLNHGILPRKIDVLSKEIDVQKEIDAILTEINNCFEEDDKTRKSDRRFYRHQPDKSLDEMIDTATGESEEINLSSPDEWEASLDISDQIENPSLLAAWESLSPMDHEIITLHKVDGFTLKQVAEFFNQPYERVIKSYQRAINRLRKNTYKKTVPFHVLPRLLCEGQNTRPRLKLDN